MPYLYNVSHPNEIIKTKVNYFVNYYTFVVNQMGGNSDYEIENILSLVEKIIFQLRNNFENSYSFIKSYLTNPLIHSNNKYFQAYHHYNLISKQADDFRNNISESDKKGKRWLTKNKQSFLDNLKKFKTYLKKYMFKQALKSIIRFLECPHELKEHKEELKHFALLIAVELFYERKEKADIKQVFDKIFTKDFEVFPFCENLVKENKENIDQVKKNFLESITLDQQFQGIRNFLKQEERKYYFVFRIGNIDCDVDFYFKYKDVEFHGTSNSRIQQLKENFSEKREKYLPEFFDEQFNLYVIVYHKAKSSNNAVNQALKKAIVLLNYINNVCETSAFIDRHSHLCTSDFVNIEYSIAIGGTARRLTESNIKKLAGLNVFQYLESKSIKSKKYFLQNEKTYIKAKNSGEIDIYWQYIENLIGKPAKDKFALIISKNYYKVEIELIENYIKNCLGVFHFNSEVFGLSNENKKFLLNEMLEKDNFDFDLLINHIQNEFIIDLINYRNQIQNKNNYDYILRIINEVYEHRNFIQHLGENEEKSVLKLNATIPLLFSMFRRNIIDSMCKHPNKNFNEIITILHRN